MIKRVNSILKGNILKIKMRPISLSDPTIGYAVQYNFIQLRISDFVT